MKIPRQSEPFLATNNILSLLSIPQEITMNNDDRPPPPPLDVTHLRTISKGKKK